MRHLSSLVILKVTHAHPLPLRGAAGNANASHGGVANIQRMMARLFRILTVLTLAAAAILAALLVASGPASAQEGSSFVDSPYPPYQRTGVPCHSTAELVHRVHASNHY